MADSDLVTQARINYYWREKWYRHMYNVCMEGMKKYGNDPVLKFFAACAMILEDRVGEGMQDLEMTKDKRDLNLCSYMALITAHRKAKTIDREAVVELESRLKDERKQAGEKGLYFAGLFLFHNGRYDKSKEYVDRALRLNDKAPEILTLKGWIDLMSSSESLRKKSIKYFDEALSVTQSRDLGALFGKAKCLEKRLNLTGALEVINQAVVNYPQDMNALVEKMRLQLATKDWDQAAETAERIQAIDAQNIEALKFQTLQLLCRDGNYQEAVIKLQELNSALDSEEPRNPALCCDVAALCSRVCGRQMSVLQNTYHLAERAVQMNSSCSDYVTELGSQLMLQDRSRDALRCFRNAMKLDDNSLPALRGVIRCQLLEGHLEEAANQLDFLAEIEQNIGKNSELIYLRANLARQRGRAPEEIMRMLNECVEAHFAGLQSIPMSERYFVHLNPDLLLEIIREILQLAPQQPKMTGQQAHPALKRCARLLEPITSSVPGLMEALFLTARVRYLSGDVDAAKSTLLHCLDIDSTFSDAHILMAQILLHQGNFKQANQSLETGLSYNFEVREHPVYHLIKARILKKQGETDEALKVLQLALSLPGVKSAGQGKGKNEISSADRVSVFLEMAECHIERGEQHEAAKVMQDAQDTFAGSAEELRITIANSDLALNRGDVEMALAILRNIGPEQPYFVQAREKMAQIYLKHRKDKRLYASCYRELAEKNPTPHTLILLGDAYLSIQEPEKAIEWYEKALKQNPRDFALASKIGQALVRTHNYGRAINYYEAALRTGNQNFLRADLAELLLRLKQYEKCEKLLLQALEAESSSELESVILNARYLMLLGKLKQHTEGSAQANEVLLKAKDMFSRILKRVSVEQPDLLPVQRKLAIEVCAILSRHSREARQFDQAVQYYKEALNFSDNDPKVMLELCRLYLVTDDLDACQHLCVTLLKGDQENDAATVMMADLMFRKGEYDQATIHFQQLLKRKPDQYSALARLLELQRRAGRLSESSAFLQQAKASNPRAPLDPGFNYCQGLYHWYMGEANTALLHFNKARRDSEFGQDALYCMIEICLNPDSDIVGGEVLDSVTSDEGQAADKAEGEKLAVSTAQKLIKELKKTPGNLKPILLENMALVASRGKQQVEKALQQFMEIASNEQGDHVGALYGMAAAYMVLKQTPRARNQLKRVAKTQWNSEDGEDLEKCWLLLADIYIQTAKYDMATEMIKRVLQYNKSCCKAYEFMGFIMEKEQSFKDAASAYENAWKYGSKQNPAIGFKLAFNYLKAKRFVDAVDISHHVLKIHPNYPKIKKDIMDKARLALRM